LKWDFFFLIYSFDSFLVYPGFSVILVDCCGVVARVYFINVYSLYVKIWTWGYISEDGNIAAKLFPIATLVKITKNFFLPLRKISKAQGHHSECILAQDTTVFGGQKAYENFMLLHSTTERYH
jgi:hypothetical protein